LPLFDDEQLAIVKMPAPIESLLSSNPGEIIWRVMEVEINLKSCMQTSCFQSV